MPEMSGFELLSIVRRQFPTISLVAMSGAFSGTQIPCGVTADAFYEKGNGVAVLLRRLRVCPLEIGNLANLPNLSGYMGTGAMPTGWGL
jgi:hypothetical protein